MDANYKQEAERLYGRLMSADPDFDDCTDAANLLRQLVAEIEGPDGFATWKDAAIAERLRRVEAEKVSHPSDNLQQASTAQPSQRSTSFGEKVDELLAYLDGLHISSRIVEEVREALDTPVASTAQVEPAKTLHVHHVGTPSPMPTDAAMSMLAAGLQNARNEAQSMEMNNVRTTTQNNAAAKYAISSSQDNKTADAELEAVAASATDAAIIEKFESHINADHFPSTEPGAISYWITQEEMLKFAKSISAQATPKLPSTPDEVIAFIGTNFNSVEKAPNKENWRYYLTLHDLLSSFRDLQDFPAAQATPEGADLPRVVSAFRTELTDAELSDPEFTRAYIEGCNESFAEAMDEIKTLRAALAATTAAEPVDANRLAMWLSASMDQHSRAGEMRQHIQAWLDLNRASPPQQVDTGGLPG